MIELKGVSKIYKSKKSTNTVALDNVSLNIGKTGMVFIVGKSGSGKSTMLNLLGGLDKPTSGDIYVAGRRINKFRQGNYDKYRNTCVGFIFQEFNVLEQYNVYQNIELAVKLKRGKTNKKEIDSLLDKIGIGGLGNRKINELSGGQKQRVSIARALIKKPKIILADEPTGNLDSKSSAQIFDILKSISEDTLVIVVSHDMESANKYADRVIEIKDGKVIKDTKKEEISGTGNSFKLTKSHLPLFYAFKMALNSLKAKPIKLFFTVLLTAMSLVFMGISLNSTIYDYSDMQARVMDDNKNYIYSVIKLERKGFDEKYLKLEENDILKLNNETGSKVNPYYVIYDKDENLKLEVKEVETKNKYFEEQPRLDTFIMINDDRILTNLVGEKPTETSIVITKYAAEYIVQFGILDSNNKIYKPESIEKLIEEKHPLKLGSNPVTISGVINNGNKIYEEVKSKGRFKNDSEEGNFHNEYVEPSHYVYVSNDFFDKIKAKVDKNKILTRSSVSYEKGDLSTSSSNLDIIKKQKYITKDGLKEISTLNKDEVILSYDALSQLYEDYASNLDEYVKKNKNKVYEDIILEYTMNFIKKNSSIFNLTFNLESECEMDFKKIPLKVVGITVDDATYLSKKIVDDYEPSTKDIVGVKVYNNNINELKKFFKEYEQPIDSNELKDGITYNIIAPYESAVGLVVSVYYFGSKYMIIVSLVFVFFTFLLFSNFIAVSISYCKKEIGILKAIGTSSFDVLKIFGVESVIIGLLSWILSSVGFYYVCYILNKSIFNNRMYVFNGIVAHPIIVLELFAFTLAIAVCITIISTGRLTKIKPIDAILNK